MELNQVKKILIINLGGIGDILLSTPALRALKRHFPQAIISILIFKPSYELVTGLSYIENIFSFQRGCSPEALLRNVFVLKALRRQNFDLSLNMRTMLSRKSAFKIRLLLGLIRPKIKVGRDTEGRGDFFDIRIPETDSGQKYEMEYDIDTVLALGVKAPDRKIDFEIGPAAIDKVNRILKESGVRPQDLVVGIHPGGKPSHRWPLENFAQVVNEISKRINCKFITTGSSAETALVERLKVEAGERLINFSGGLNLQELGALLKRCGVYICNDTAVMHIAAVLDVPMVAIFGAGYLTRFDPRNLSGRAVVFYKNAECSPCDQINCASLKCLREITPPEIVSAVLSIVEGSLR